MALGDMHCEEGKQFSCEACAKAKAGRRLVGDSTVLDCEDARLPSAIGIGGTILDFLIAIFLMLYMFKGLAEICDSYFEPALQGISEALKLSADVAGATFMAAGSSAPELFTSIVGVFAVKNDVGIGTIVGSAVFNLCCIIGGTALFTPMVLKIDWKPITRDTFFYALSIAAMTIVLRDGLVTF